MQINKSITHNATKESPSAKGLGPGEHRSYWRLGWIGSYKPGLLKLQCSDVF